MISKRTAKLIELLPKPMVKRVAAKYLDWYLNKYADISVVNGDVLKNIKDPVIFVSNHLSNTDALVLNKVLGAGRVHFVAGVKLTENDLTRLGLDVVKTIPINPCTADRKALSCVVKTLKSGQSVHIFPEGTRSRKGSMLKGKKGILLISKLSGRPIVPIGLEGTEKLMPINDEDMGKEKFYHAKVKVTIGESFYLTGQEPDEDKSSYEERALDFVMNSIASLLSPAYRGVYAGK